MLEMIRCNGVCHNPHLGSIQPCNAGLSVLVNIVLSPSKILTSVGVNIVAHVAYTNLIMLNNEFCCNPGAKSTILASSLIRCRNFSCSVAVATYLHGVWNTFPDDMPIGMNGSMLLLPLNVAPESATIENMVS